MGTLVSSATGQFPFMSNYGYQPPLFPSQELQVGFSRSRSTFDGLKGDQSSLVMHRIKELADCGLTSMPRPELTTGAEGMAVDSGSASGWFITQAGTSLHHAIRGGLHSQPLKIFICSTQLNSTQLSTFKQPSLHSKCCTWSDYHIYSRPFTVSDRIDRISSTTVTKQLHLN